MREGNKPASPNLWEEKVGEKEMHEMSFVTYHCSDVLCDIIWIKYAIVLHAQL